MLGIHEEVRCRNYHREPFSESRPFIIGRARLDTDDGEYRGAAVRWGAGFFTSLTVPRGGRR